MPHRAVAHAIAEAKRVARAETKVHARLRGHLTAIIVLTVGIDLVCAVLAYLFEHGARQTQIKTFGSAIFWTTTQLLTVSSQLPNPISSPGRVLDVFMEMWAVTVIATLAASIGSFLVRRGEADV